MNDQSWWQVVAIPALIASIPGLIKFWQWWGSRSDKKSDREMSREERRDKEMDSRQTVLTKQQADWFTDLRAENTVLRKRCDDLDRDRNRGWDLARYWHGRAHEMMRAFRNLRHDVTNDRQNMLTTYRNRLPTETEPQWEPIPDAPAMPMGLEEPK